MPRTLKFTLLFFIYLYLNIFEVTNAKLFPIWPNNVSYTVEFDILDWIVSIPIDVINVDTPNGKDIYYSIYSKLNMFYGIGNNSFFIYPKIGDMLCHYYTGEMLAVDYLPPIENTWNHIMEKDGLDYWSSTSNIGYNQLNNSMIFISRASDNSPVLLQATSGYPYDNPYFYPTRISYSNFKTDKLTIPVLPEICRSKPKFKIGSDYPHISFLLKELSGMVTGLSYNKDVIYHHEFSNFILKYSKSYKDKEEYNRRLEIFKQNLQIINEHNKRTDKSYSLGITKFSDISNEEFRTLYTRSRKDHISDDILKNTETHKRISNIVIEHVDWVRRGVVNPIKDQALCGSCWAFSAISALESIWAIKTGDLYSLSEQQILNCVLTETSSCDGGNAYEAFKWLSRHGISLESTDPYLMVDGNCRYEYDTPVKIKKNIIVLDNVIDMMDAVANYGPIVIDIYINEHYDKFKLYNDGVYIPEYDNCGMRYSNHQAVIVGYGKDIDSNGQTIPYWLIRNSWGPYWGIKGYLKLFRESESEDVYCIITSAIYPLVETN